MWEIRWGEDRHLTAMGWLVGDPVVRQVNRPEFVWHVLSQQGMRQVIVLRCLVVLRWRETTGARGWQGQDCWGGASRQRWGALSWAHVSRQGALSVRAGLWLLSTEQDTWGVPGRGPNSMWRGVVTSAGG